jgi:hypothetical protein
MPKMSKNPNNKIENAINTIQEVCDYGVAKLYEEEEKRVSNLMNKGCPYITVIKNGKINNSMRLSFEQKPYVNRYFILRHVNGSRMFNEKTMSIDANFAQEQNYSMFDWLKISPEKWNNFIEKTKKFEDKLDKSDEIKTFLDGD